MPPLQKTDFVAISGGGIIDRIIDGVVCMAFWTGNMDVCRVSSRVCVSVFIGH